MISSVLSHPLRTWCSPPHNQLMRDAVPEISGDFLLVTSVDMKRELARRRSGTGKRWSR
jgi:hypothetical protein